MRQRASRRKPVLGAGGSAILLGGLGLGVTAMYFLDPAQGHRRRVRIGHGVRKAAQSTGAGLAQRAHTVQQRVGVLAAGVGSRLHRRAAPDEVVLARVQAAVNRRVLHPGLVTTRVADGRVTIEGTVLAGEHARVVRAVRHARGVRRVVDRLVVHSALDPLAAAGWWGQRRWPVRAAVFAAGAMGGAVGGALVAQGVRRGAAS